MAKKKKNPTVPSPIPTVQVINDPQPALPRAERGLSLDKGQGKHNKIYKSQRQGEEEPQGIGEKTTWENVARFSSCMLLYDDGVGAEGEAGGWQRISGHSQIAYSIWKAGGLLLSWLSNLERGSTGPEILVWLLHLPQLPLKQAPLKECI